MSDVEAAITLVNAVDGSRFTFGKQRVFHYVPGCGYVELTDEERAEAEKNLSPGGMYQVVSVDADSGELTIARKP